MTEKNISFTEIGRDLWAFTAEGDPNSGVIIGDDSVMIVEAQATPRLANKVIEKVRSVTDKPISHLVLTHYHAVRVLGASAYNAPTVIMGEKARAMVAERGAGRLGQRVPALPASVPGPREHSRPDLADDHLFTSA
jgi:glyoxylase-like metal-dependent hydrolase (beta-lactamase superfamily II)